MSDQPQGDEWSLLSNQEKAHALQSLIKNLEYNKFYSDQQRLAELAMPEPDETIVLDYQRIVDACQIKQDFYISQLAEIDLSVPEE